MTELIQDLESVHLKRPSIITIGSFDGVHLGHQHLIQSVISRGHSLNLASIVVTLNPHPKLVLRPDSDLHLISTLDERLERLSQLGPDYIVLFPFSIEHTRLSAREFVQLLRNHLNMRELQCGPNFALGYKREGTIPVLQDLGAELGFGVQVVEPRAFTQGIISSTRIRELISRGDVHDAFDLLGGYPFLRGSVIHGDHRGRTLGYPTANLEVADHKLIPANGIYAVYVRLGDEWFNGAASVGVRPTFGDGKRLVEVYLLDFNREIYGQQLQVRFVERLRDELRFNSVEALVEQIALDVENARQILSIAPAPFKAPVLSR